MKLEFERSSGTSMFLKNKAKTHHFHWNLSDATRFIPPSSRCAENDVLVPCSLLKKVHVEATDGTRRDNLGDSDLGWTSCR